MLKEVLFLTLFFLTFNLIAFSQSETMKEDPALATFELEELVSQLEESGRPWIPFFKGKNVLTGIYRLKAGAEDLQQPHDTDEVYYVASGKAKFTVGDETVDIKGGDHSFRKSRS